MAVNVYGIPIPGSVVAAAAPYVGLLSENEVTDEEFNNFLDGVIDSVYQEPPVTHTSSRLSSSRRRNPFANTSLPVAKFARLSGGPVAFPQYINTSAVPVLPSFSASGTMPLVRTRGRYAVLGSVASRSLRRRRSGSASNRKTKPRRITGSKRVNKKGASREYPIAITTRARRSVRHEVKMHSHALNDGAGTPGPIIFGANGSTADDNVHARFITNPGLGTSFDQRDGRVIRSLGFHIRAQLYAGSGAGVNGHPTEVYMALVWHGEPQTNIPGWDNVFDVFGFEQINARYQHKILFLKHWQLLGQYDGDPENSRTGVFIDESIPLNVLTTINPTAIGSGAIGMSDVAKGAITLYWWSNIGEGEPAAQKPHIYGEFRWWYVDEQLA